MKSLKILRTYFIVLSCADLDDSQSALLRYVIDSISSPTPIHCMTPLTLQQTSFLTVYSLVNIVTEAVLRSLPTHVSQAIDPFRA